MKAALITIILAAMTCLAQAQDKFTIAGGGGKAQGSVYSSVLGDLAEACSTEALTLSETNTNGGVRNLELLLGNKVAAAIVPQGLLFRARDENPASVATIKTLFALHPEAIYLIARSDVKEEGGFGVGKFKLGVDKIVFNNPEDLKGRPVGAVGGSFVDGQSLSDKMRFGWNMTAFDKTSDLLAALTTGKIDAVVIQAGVPSPAVAGLKGAFKIIPLRGNSDTQAVWSPIKVQYSNMNSGRSVDTLAAPALLVTRRWSSAAMQAKLSELVSCYKTKLGDIKDKTGTDPVWQGVELEDQGKWPMFETSKAPAVVGPSR